MVDRTSLGMIGYLLCAVTAAVAMIAAVVVMDHISGRLGFDGGNMRLQAMPTTIQATPTSAR